MKRQIIAMGGGGFSMEPENPLLDDYILAQLDIPCPKVAFISTASQYDADYCNRFYKAFEKKSCVPNHLNPQQENLEAFILSQDVVYVSGGNTLNMLKEWKAIGLDEILRKAYHQGIILCGLSAGAICWFEEGLTDSRPGALSRLECLGFLKGSNCPHFDGEPERQEAYKTQIYLGEMKAGIACDDGVGLHYVNEELVHIVSSRSQAKAFHFEVSENNLKQTSIEPMFLKNVLIK